MKPKKKTSKANSMPDLKGKEVKAQKAEAVKGGISGSGDGNLPMESSFIMRSGPQAKMK
jgi:hypothetical protein